MKPLRLTFSSLDAAWAFVKLAEQDNPRLGFTVPDEREGTSGAPEWVVLIMEAPAGADG